MMGEMYIAEATDERIRERGEHGGVVTALLKFALESGMVDAVLAVKKRNGNRYDGVPSLITEPEEVLECAGVLHCAPVNVARCVKEYLDGAKGVRLAVVCKPCDARAMIELAKREQINLANVIMIGMNCTGTLAPSVARKMLVEEFGVDPEDVVREDIDDGKLIITLGDGSTREKDLKELEERGYGRRENCRRCEVSVPRMADLACGKWGVLEGRRATFVEVCSERGGELLRRAAEAGVIRVEAPSKKAIDERERKEREALERSKEWQERYFGELKEMSSEERRRYWFDYFDRCIKCFGCRDACPICYCKECYLEAWRGFIRGGEVPPERAFPLIRLAHVADSCVNCGQCQDACPAEIPLSRLYQAVNKELQRVFKYVPGMSVEERPPLTVITEEELRNDDPLLFLRTEM
ncbi:MAG TPA: formate dehydrogenase [Methanomicrobia archaeon]|nr:formate dehydrogenase [Methanomicrobia archaeon]HEX59857.1 formate dehydrogenase [Methanomicrobia archaeon]